MNILNSHMYKHALCYKHNISNFSECSCFRLNSVAITYSIRQPEYIQYSCCLDSGSPANTLSLLHCHTWNGRLCHRHLAHTTHCSHLHIDLCSCSACPYIHKPCRLLNTKGAADKCCCPNMYIHVHSSVPYNHYTCSLTLWTFKSEIHEEREDASCTGVVGEGSRGGGGREEALDYQCVNKVIGIPLINIVNQHPQLKGALHREMHTQTH